MRNSVLNCYVFDGANIYIFSIDNNFKKLIKTENFLSKIFYPLFCKKTKRQV